MGKSVAVRSWGNSFGIRIPADILKKLDISESDEFNITTEKNAIVLRKAFKHKSFKERLEEYDGKIDIREFDWGEAKGKELL